MKRVLIVTGGSRGIGHATSVLAAEAGWDICVNYLSNKARADETVARIKATGKRAIAVQADINNEQDVIRLFETCTSELGEIKGVVNSAGIVEPYCRVDELKYEEIVTLINVNVVAVMLVTREAIKLMSTKNNRSGGSIVLLSSVAARI